MITYRGLAARTVLVIATAAFAVAVPLGTIAQDTGIGPWWRDLGVPDLRTQTTLIQIVRAMPASTFDEKLPPLRLDEWLFVTLAPRVEVLRSQLVDWRMDFCGPYASGANPAIVTATGPELCVIGTVRFSAERNVELVIVVADTVSGALAWRPTPSLRSIYIERVKESTRIDSLDVPELGSLPDLLQTPFAEWPRANLESQITWAPTKPLPGDTVRFSILVRNTGRRSADRAWVTILISPCCDNSLEIRREWFPYVAADQSVRVDVQVPLPEGRAFASVSVTEGPSSKTRRETHQDKPPTVVSVGDPPNLR